MAPLFLAHPVYILVGWCRRLSRHSITSYKSMPTAFGWYWTTLSVCGRRFQLPTTLCRRSMWDISRSHWLLAMPKAVSRAGCLDVWTVSGENLMHKNVGCNTAIQRLLTPPKFHTKNLMHKNVGCNTAIRCLNTPKISHKNLMHKNIGCTTSSNK